MNVVAVLKRIPLYMIGGFLLGWFAFGTQLNGGPVTRVLVSILAVLLVIGHFYINYGPKYRHL